MKKNKIISKTVISVATLTTAITPLSSVISCGTKDENDLVKSKQRAIKTITSIIEKSKSEEAVEKDQTVIAARQKFATAVETAKTAINAAKSTEQITTILPVQTKLVVTANKEIDNAIKALKSKIDASKQKAIQTITSIIEKSK